MRLGSAFNSVDRLTTLEASTGVIPVRVSDVAERMMSVPEVGCTCRWNNDRP